MEEDSKVVGKDLEVARVVKEMATALQSRGPLVEAHL